MGRVAIQKIARWEPILRIGISGVLFWAGISKMARPDLFAAAIDHYRLLPDSVSVVLAYYLPWLEIVAAAGLFSSRSRVGAALLAAGLFTLFFLALVSALARGLDIRCGCFGAGAESGRAVLLVAALRAALLCAAAVAVFRANRGGLTGQGRAV